MYDLNVIEADDELTGFAQESFVPEHLQCMNNVVGSGNPLAYAREMNRKLCNGPAEFVREASRLHLHSTDPNNMRLYISPKNSYGLSYFQNKLSTLLYSLKSDQTLTILIGSGVDEWWSVPTLGAVLTAMQNCRGKVVTVVTSRCTFVESVLWLFGKEREISPYGEVMLMGAEGILNSEVQYLKPIYERIYRRAQELGMISPEKVEELCTSKEILRFGNYEG